MWKWQAVAEFGAGRPLAWLDDDFGQFGSSRGTFGEQRGSLPTLLHTISPRVGITADDLDVVERWARGLGVSDPKETT